MEKKRSVGVIVFGLLFTTIAVFFFFSGGPLRVTLRLFTETIKGPDEVFAFLLDFLFPITLLITGIGLFLLKSWGRKLALFAVPLFTFVYFFEFRFGLYVGKEWVYPMPFAEKSHNELMRIEWEPFFNILTDAGIFSIIVTAIVISPIIIYFTRPKVKEGFKKEV